MKRMRVQAGIVAACAVLSCLLGACETPEEDSRQPPVPRGRYLEQDTALPSLIEVAAFTQVAADAFYVLGKENGLDDPYRIWRSADGGNTWDVEAAPALDGKEISYAVFDGQGGVYYSHRTAKGERGMADVYDTAYLDAGGNTGVVAPGEAEIGLDQILLADGVLWIGRQDSLRAVDVQTGRPTATSLQLEADTVLEPGRFCTYDDALAVAGQGQIHLYDASTGEYTGAIPYTAPGGATPVIAVQPERAGFFYCDSTGLYRVSMDGGITEQIIDGSLAYFSQPTVQLERLYACTDGSFLLLYLENRAFHLRRLVFDADAARQPRRRLSLYTLRHDPFVQQAIGLYQQKNPDVAINYHVGVPEDGAWTSGDAIRTLTTEILAGKGPDLLVLDGLSIDSYIDRGVLADLREALAGEWDDLLTNARAVYLRDGAVWAVPTRVSVPLLVGTDVEGIRGIGELAAHIGEHNQPVRLHSPSAVEHLYPALAASWLPGGGSVDKDALRRDIAALRGISDLLELRAPSQDTNTQAMLWMHEKQPLVISTLVNLEDMAGIYTAIAARGAGSVNAFPSGQGGVFVPGSILGVCRQGESIADAMDFVRFSVGEAAQTQGLGNGLAVNREALGRMAASREPGEQSFRMQSHSSGSDEVLELIAYWPTAEQMQEAICLIEGAQTPVSTGESVRELIVREGASILAGEDVEGAVDSLAQRLELFLKEGG